MKARPAYITRYYKHLLPDYPDDVHKILVQHILNEASRASTRRAYQDVCGLIKLLAKAGGSTHAGKVVETLLQAYPKKPAFREELGRIRL